MPDNTNAKEGLKIALDVHTKLVVISKPLGAKLAEAIRLLYIYVLHEDEEDTDTTS